MLSSFRRLVCIKGTIRRISSSSSSSSSVRSTIIQKRSNKIPWIMIGGIRNMTATTTTTTRSILPWTTRAVGGTLCSSFSSLRLSFRSFSSSSSTEEKEQPREVMPYDVVIVGGGPAGLAASIRLKQLCQQHNHDLSVCLVEKGSEIGSHILSGNVLDPRGIHELFPDLSSRDDDDWTTALQQSQGSHATRVQQDKFIVLTSDTSSFTIPNFLLPHQLHNDKGNYIISLSQVCRWLATQAEELGVEIYPGFSASHVLVEPTTTSKNDNNNNSAASSSGVAVKGIATRDVGLDKQGNPKSTFERGVELRARQTLFAEGARGSCSEFIINEFNLRGGDSSSGDGILRRPQAFGLGLKEVWEVPESQFQAGLVQHTLGYPLQSSPLDKTFGGSFLYHQEPNLVLVGLVVGLDYANPYLNPYQEFQRLKLHPAIRRHLEGGTCVSYGARVLNEGGYHSLPKLTFPGGALLGCSAGFLNAVKIKGTHTAMKSGILAAEAIFEALRGAFSSSSSVAETGEMPEDDPVLQVVEYETAVKNSWIHEELYEVRNTHEAFARWGVGPGVAYTGLAAHLTKGREPWTLSSSSSSTKLDSNATQPADQHSPISYPPPDGKLTFDLLTNLQRSGVYHEEDQPCHLRVKNKAHIKVSMDKYDGPEQRFCPAAVYEYVETDTSSNSKDDNDDKEKKQKGEKQLVINAQNCIHCKCCSIKMPHEYINWTVPEGGGGPQYQVM